MPTFGEIYDEFYAKIHRYLTRMVGPTDAEDAAQEVFARISRALPAWRGEAKLSTWVYRIATNLAVDRGRQLAAQRAGQTLLQIGRTLSAPPRIDDEVSRAEGRDCIRRYVDNLPVVYRSVLLLSEVEGLSNREIAEALGISVDTAKIRLHRARARLRRELAGGCAVFRDERNELACEPRPTGVSPSR
jgi:RNA polymerase sigma-70 factor (ECF subfamily)